VQNFYNGACAAVDVVGMADIGEIEAIIRTAMQQGSSLAEPVNDEDNAE